MTHFSLSIVVDAPTSNMSPAPAVTASLKVIVWAANDLVYALKADIKKLHNFFMRLVTSSGPVRLLFPLLDINIRAAVAVLGKGHPLRRLPMKNPWKGTRKSTLRTLLSNDERNIRTKPIAILGHPVRTTQSVGRAKTVFVIIMFE